MASIVQARPQWAELLPEVTQRIAGLLDDKARRAGRRGKPSRHRCGLLLPAQAAAARCRRRQLRGMSLLSQNSCLHH